MPHRPKQSASSAQALHFWEGVEAGNASRLQALLTQIGETAFGRLAARPCANGETALMLAAAPEHAIWPQARHDMDNIDALRTLPDGRCAVDVLLPFSDPLALHAGKDALAHALANRNEAAARSLIPVSDLELKTPDGYGEALGILARALTCGSYDVAALVIAALPPERLREAGQNGDTPLMLAIGSGLGVLPLLLEHNDVHARNLAGQTALMLAAARNDSDAMETLAPLSAFSARDNEGRDVLMHAAANESHHVLEALLASPFFDPQSLLARDAQGLTPLMLAARGNFYEGVRLLLPGSDIAALDANGHCAFSFALGYQDDDGDAGWAAANEIALLVDPDATRPDGRTLLRMAVDAQAWTTAGALFPRASDANVEDAFRAISALLMGEAAAACADAFFLTHALQAAAAAKSGRGDGNQRLPHHAQNGNGPVDSEQGRPLRLNARGPRL